MKKSPADGGLPQRPVYIAITTPFDAAGKIVPAALSRHLAFLSGHQINHILLGGTTGEGIRMASGQRIALLRAARPAFTGTLAFNVSSASLGESIALAQQAEMAGADELVFTLPPCSHSVPPTGLFDYVEKLASSTPEAKFWLYLHPSIQLGRSQIDDVLTHIVDLHPNIIGMKDSSPGTSVAAFCRRVMGAAKRDFKILTGNDSVIETAMHEGLCDGVVSGSCNPFPELLLQFVAALETSQADLLCELRELLNRWLDVLRSPYKFANWVYGSQEVAAIKLALNAVLDGGYPLDVLPPLCSRLAPDNVEAVLKTARHLRSQTA